MGIRLMQASFDGTSMIFVTLSGEELCQIKAKPTDLLADIFLQLPTRIGSIASQVDAVLPEGEVPSNVLRNNPSATISGHFSCQMDTSLTFWRIFFVCLSDRQTAMMMRKRSAMHILC